MKNIFKKKSKVSPSNTPFVKIRYVCIKHGELEKGDRLMWGFIPNNQQNGPWCRLCFNNEFMDKVCGKLLKVVDDHIVDDHDI